MGTGCFHAWSCASGRCPGPSDSSAWSSSAGGTALRRAGRRRRVEQRLSRKAKKESLKLKLVKKKAQSAQLWPSERLVYQTLLEVAEAKLVAKGSSSNKKKKIKTAKKGKKEKASSSKSKKFKKKKKKAS